ncbi:MAG: hypothetical protein HOV79_05115, partial [Hamadaea sp.]|nr:hypothetical protein [Hamadaea sp.]
MRRHFGFRAASGLLLVVVAGLLGLVAPGNATAKPDDPRDDYARIKAELKKTGAVLDGATKRAADAVARHQADVAALPGAEDRAAEARGAV